MEYQFIFAILFIVIATILSPWVRAWDARRFSFLKGKDYDQAIKRINSCQPAETKPYRIVQITPFDQITVQGGSFYFSISKGALAKLSTAELKYAIVHNRMVSRKKNKYLLIIPICLAVKILLIFLESNFLLPVPDDLHTILTVGMGPIIVFITASYNEVFSAQADNATCEITQDKSAAISLLKKLLDNAQLESNDSTVKSLKSRINSLESIQFIPDTSNSGTAP